MRPVNYLTIDVEDFFQVSAFESLVSKESWSSFPSRVEKNTRKILSLLEEHQVTATFFVLGWVAEKYPAVVKAIANGGHEIGCHSFYHRLVYNLNPEIFHEDTKKAKDTLEQLTGREVTGYRAPSYSITSKSLWALQVLFSLGFTYDSSIFPIIHDRYGLPEAPRFPFYWDLSGEHPAIIDQIPPPSRPELSQQVLAEYPLSTAPLFGRKIPIAGGGYFRLFPYWFTKSSLKKINTKEQNSFIFYLHPWELDPDQPRFKKASLLSKFRHYNNLAKTSHRFSLLLKDFQFGPISNQIHDSKQ